MESVLQPAQSPVELPGADHRHKIALPELLSPAGDWDCARAAVENGADAIYFGLDKFNARMRAHNFTVADLPKLLEYLHGRGVRAYVTFNTLVFENELAEAQEYLRSIISAGVDAIIVQDVGICRLIRTLSPDFPIHVSTQMTVTSANGVSFARELGCNLVVLARECSLKELQAIQEAQRAEEAAPAGTPLPLEVFVHGALCVAYSGQCLTSEALGGRSANRGECAQACRMPYDLLADGALVNLDDRKYLLSPQDLAGLDALKDLVPLGVASLKIEGRLKTPEYVANITRIYRRTLDQVVANLTPPPEEARQARYAMEMSFSRGLYTGWFNGINNQELVHARFGKKRGVYLGEIVAVGRDSVTARLASALKPGDGVVFDAGKPEEAEEGGRVYQVTPNSKRASEAGAGVLVRLGFGTGDVDFSRIHAGDKLWKTSDPELEKQLRQTFQSELPNFQRPISMEVHGCVDRPLTVLARDELGHVAQAESQMPLLKANKRPLTTELLKEQFGRLGGTAFRLGDLANSLQGEVLLPVSEMNRMRRELVSKLVELRVRPLRWRMNPPQDAVAMLCPARTSQPPRARVESELIVLVRSLEQLESALSAKIKTIYCELEDPKKYREAVARVRGSGSSIWVAPPRIFKMGEEWTLQQVRSSDADGYLVRNYDHLKAFEGQRRIGDYSLNVANRLTADYFRNRFDLEYVTASYDLNIAQLDALLRTAPPDWFEITIHQHMPMFHMEHCVFCAFLSSGTDYRNCGRPCDKHDLKLKDRVGAEHPVKADAGCRNTVYNGRAQTGAEFVEHLQGLGATRFRIEFLNEKPAEVQRTIEKYRDLLAGRMSGQELWRELKVQNQLGVTRGQLAGSAHSRV